MLRTLVVVAHADDETIALGARLGRFATRFVYVTDGAPRDGRDAIQHGFDSVESYRAARWRELADSFAAANIVDPAWECLDVTDQEAALHLVDITVRLGRILRDYAPQIIITHPYEGGHPDHDSCAFAVHHAIYHESRSLKVVPLIIEAPFYHMGEKGIETGSFIPVHKSSVEVAYELTEQEQHKKQARLNCFTTQQQTLGYFATHIERFRIAPVYDFKNLPHSGPVFYDQHPWGVTSGRFCELAAEAECALRLQEVVLACR